MNDRARNGITRRELGLLVGGGVVLAGCASADTVGAGSGVLGARPADRTVTLPAPVTTGGGSLTDALARRHSVREFAATPLERAALGQLLWAAQGVTHGQGRRTAPSAGALYPLDLYVVFDATLWHYRPAGHQVDEWDLEDDVREGLYGATPGQGLVRAAPVVVVVTGTASRSSGKYGARASRYVALEAGHCAQNLVLQATALGLGGVTIGAFSDTAVRDVLGLPRTVTPYYLVPLGHPAPGA